MWWLGIIKNYRQDCHNFIIIMFIMRIIEDKKNVNDH